MRCCNGRCNEFVAKMPSEGSRYANGQKRCNVCERYLMWDGLFCPCCGSQLRQRTRNPVLREKFLTINRI